MAEGFERFARLLADARRGAWQAVHGLEGSLPLILALEGPATVVSLARTVYERPWLWTQ